MTCAYFNGIGPRGAVSDGGDAGPGDLEEVVSGSDSHAGGAGSGGGGVAVARAIGDEGDRARDLADRGQMEEALAVARAIGDEGDRARRSSGPGAAIGRVATHTVVPTLVRNAPTSRDAIAQRSPFRPRVARAGHRRPGRIGSDRRDLYCDRRSRPLVAVSHGRSEPSQSRGVHGRDLHQGYALLIGVGQAAVRKVVTPSDREGRPGDPGRADRPEPLRLSRRPCHLLHDRQATRDAILEGLDWLAQQVAAEPHATAVVYFSGHGWLKKRTSRYFLIPHDVDPLDIPGSAIPAAEFIKALRRIKAERLLAIMDCCHAEGMATAKGGSSRHQAPHGSCPRRHPRRWLMSSNRARGEPSSPRRVAIRSRGCGPMAR